MQKYFNQDQDFTLNDGKRILLDFCLYTIKLIDISQDNLPRPTIISSRGFGGLFRKIKIGKPRTFTFLYNE